MSDKINKESEEMKSVIAASKDLRSEQEENEYKKFWSEIKVPFSLHEELSKYKKYELDSIRKKLQIKNASSLKKAELILLLEEKIPEYLENIYRLWDSERFKLVMKIASSDGYIIAPDLTSDQVNYFRGNGLVYTGTMEGKQVLAMPNELLEPIKAMKNNVMVRGIVNRNTEWIKLTRGLLYYYGTLSTNQLLEMLESYTKETIPLKEFVNVIEDSNIYRREIKINKDSFSNFRVFDLERVQQEQQTRGSMPYYPFTKQQLLVAGEPEFIDRNDSYVQIVHFLTNNFEIDRETADSFVEDCVYATRNGDSPNEVMGFVNSTFELERLDLLQAFMDQVTQLMNNTRKWYLKGYTSTELSEQEKKHLKPLSASKSNGKAQKTKKIGRNDPCPCDSGKKYKKCCGR